MVFIIVDLITDKTSPSTMATNKVSDTGALAESINIADGDINTLSLSHSSEQYSSSDYEAFASIEAELECMNAEEVTTTEEESIVLEETIEETEENINQDVEMTDVSEVVQNEEIIYTTANHANQNIVFQTKPTLQRVPISAVQVI